ncbi:RT0821/Lpp0805 family surface protein [Bartonella tamiae]|uniref:Surface antigen domain-containing protein n=1 Tax=Bartonella tamiae Th239 TaxID=1094558 RepID=J0QX14_9HYPH|nr:RT0821/Lpp0805 family surface protein [Bartonella tamiae]EJF90581.1 hypothetical protein ME5_00982 [Bartonella tamiae Th239]EJF94041.1 hypothetical protein MEG_00899 [Bartonella tamiae Th307]
MKTLLANDGDKMNKCLLGTFLALLSLTACTQTPLQHINPEIKQTNVLLQSMGNGLLGTSAHLLSPADRNQALEAEYNALEYTDAGKVVPWVSQQGNASGEVTPGQPYQVGSQNCRQYSHSFTIGGVPQTNRGSACRNENGSWSPLT